jgi:HKD family nuclease
MSWHAADRLTTRTTMALPDGLYDLLLTEGLARSLAALDPISTDVLALKGGAAEFLAEVITRQLGAILDDVAGDDADKPRRQLELVNDLLVMLRQRLSTGGSSAAAMASADVVDLVASPLRVLRAVKRDHQFPASPEIGLAVPWLFTAGKGSPSLLQEIRRELASSDQMDILVSFITVSGVRKLQDVLQQITATGARGQGVTRLRILTTTYTGATEARALDELARLPGCEVRVSLDGRRTRLHAKAWLFQRKSGFGSAYVGSANLSGAALTGGLEWTVKLTQRAQEALFARAVAHFETLWADSEFQRYDPDNVEHRQALAAALGRESFGGEPTGAISFFDLQPKTYQQEMLEQLVAERAHSRSRNLLVAATGTGKTVVAAFDYRNTCHLEGGRPRLLFVAHREEILRQALRTYREVLRDPEFGDLLTGSYQPERWDHLFATIDSVTSRDLVGTVGADH